MERRTAINVLKTLQEEGHPPMESLVQLISAQVWSKEFVYDLSMLRLLIAKQNSAPGTVDIIVTYGDGRQGGRPAPPFFDKFNITEEKEHHNLSINEVIQFLNKYIN